MGLHRDDRLDAHLADLAPEALSVHPLALERLHQRRDRALVRVVAVGLVLGLHEGLRVLVDRVIRQMHAHVAHVLLERLVLLGAHAHEPLAEDEDAQRAHAREQHVQAQVVLVTVEEVWPVQVTLHDIGLVWGNIVEAARETDANALAARTRLHDERLVAVVAVVVRQAPLELQRGVIRRHDVCGREEFVRLAAREEHLVEVARGARLAHQLKHAREVVDLLHAPQLAHTLVGHRPVRPAQLAAPAPGVLGACVRAPAQALRRLPH